MSFWDSGRVKPGMTDSGPKVLQLQPKAGQVEKRRKYSKPGASNSAAFPPYPVDLLNNATNSTGSVMGNEHVKS